MIVILRKCLIFAVEIKGARGVAQLAARHVRDVEVGSSSLLTPTPSKGSAACNHKVAGGFVYSFPKELRIGLIAKKQAILKGGLIEKLIKINAIGIVN